MSPEIFFFSRLSTPKVPFLFVVFQNVPDFVGKMVIDLGKTFGEIFMYR